MALSRLQIKNLALDEVPADRIEDEDETSLAAEVTERHYQPALELLLEDHDWDFAIRRQTLALATNDRANEWTYAYALPSDMARPRHLLRYGADETAGSMPAYPAAGVARIFHESLIPFRIADGLIYTNRETAILEYVTNAPREADFTAKFARALATELAHRIVMPLTKDSRREQELIRKSEVYRERAKADEMNRDPERTRDFIPDIQLARLGLIP